MDIHGSQATLQVIICEGLLLCAVCTATVAPLGALGNRGAIGKPPKMCQISYDISMFGSLVGVVWIV